MIVQLINESGKQDISELISSITWSGGDGQAARKLELSILSSPDDVYLPKVTINSGNMLKLLTDEEIEIFQGYVFFREKDYFSVEMRVVAYEGLIYLLKSKMSYNFKGNTPESIAAKVCTDLRVSFSNFATTGIGVNYIPIQKNGVEIIIEAYNRANNGKEYIVKMEMGKLSVKEKGATVVEKSLNPEESMIRAIYSEDIESMINKVNITDNSGKVLKVISDDELIKLYGLIQDTYEKVEGQDASAQAKGKLQGLSRKAQIEAFGDYECINGNLLKISETYTGLIGLFLISSDSHSWVDGIHKMTLTLEYKGVV